MSIRPVLVSAAAVTVVVEALLVADLQEIAVGRRTTIVSVALSVPPLSTSTALLLARPSVLRYRRDR
jgi:hypothetical protein